MILSSIPTVTQSIDSALREKLETAIAEKTYPFDANVDFEIDEIEVSARGDDNRYMIQQQFKKP